MATENEMQKFKFSKIIKKTLLGIFISVSLIIGLISAVIATEKGSRWAVVSLARIINLQLTNIKGNLLTGLDVGSIDYKKNELGIHAEKVSFRWQPLTLFYARVSIQSLSAENVLIHLPSKTKEVEPYPWPNFSQPLHIELGKFQLRSIHIQQEQKNIELNTLSGSLDLGAFRLSAKNLVVVNPQARVDANGSVGLSYPYKLNLQSKWKFQSLNPESILYDGEVKIGGDIKILKVENKLLQPFSVKTQATISPAFHNKKEAPHANLINDWSEQTIPPAFSQALAREERLHFLNNLLTSQGHLQIQGWLNKYQIQAKLQNKTANANLVADIKAQGENVFEKNDQAGKIINAKLHLEKFHMSALPLPTYKNTATNIKPDFSIESLPLDNNFVSLTGDINVLPQLQWDLVLKGEHVNLGQFFTNWPSDLQLHVVSRGEAIELKQAIQVKQSTPVNPIIENQKPEKKWRLDINQLTASGELRRLNVGAQGEIHFDGTNWKSSSVIANIGANLIEIKGRAGNDLALEWKLNAPFLNQIYPDLTGSIVSDGVIGGNFNKPRLQINAEVSQLAWRDLAINNLSLKLNPTNNNENYDLILNALHMQLWEQHFSHLNINGSGSVAQHTLNGRLENSDYGSVDFILSSGWKNYLWQGQWRDVKVNLNKIPRWDFISSTPMQADKNHIDFGKLCLTSTNELPAAIVSSSASAKPIQETPDICATGKWTLIAGTEIDINMQAVPLGQVRAWFKPEVTLAGVVDGQFNLRANVGKPVQINANAHSRDAKLLYQFQGGNVEVYPLQKGDVNLTLKDRILNTSVNMDWEKYGVINADGKYTLADKKILGKISVALPNLAPLEGLLPFLNNVQGSANAAINVAGTIDAPAVTGNFILADGSANLPKLGLELKNISLQIASTAINSAHVEGKITSGDGTLVTQGDFANIGAEDWHLSANVFGADIRIIQQTQLTANISPNLHVKANAEAINLTGSTEIPWARANVKTLPATATRISSDAVVVENDNSPSPNSRAKKAIPFYTDIILFFGDEVRFKGFGLDTRLSGKVNVLKEENRQIFTTGFVAVDKGIYKAYGQELSIERGRLIFQGPYDNPGLDIRALRIIDDQSAGLDIGGTLQRPKSTVFAIPTRTDSEAMAMLLTGKPLSQSSREDAYSIIGAISKLGMTQGDSMTTDIAHKFGLDEVTVKADKGLDQSALWIGKYITPKLFVHYVVGIFDQAFSLGMTYKLNDKLQLEAESGKTQSMDIIYKIER